ncbi:MAG TPA: protein-L-isoaspartate O-methyltransferase [Woeseiaceae bacterium]|jgi:protein-L-isoaspartate(D-aspartate) O-methyltransferase|nr:protein-L-isoaspartate O-methyltransferase [Woeseiaceae bacterium]
MPAETNTEFARTQMVAQQVRAWEVFDPRVLDVLGGVPREHFVPPAYRSLAFAETSIPLGHGQFMMPPSLEGRLLQALDPTPADQVLEIGTGSGFLSACLSKLARSVVSVELFSDLSDTAAAKLAALDIGNVTLLTIDATRELPEGRFDAIAVTASLPLFDMRFFEVLNPGGRLFVIIGSPPVMEAQLVVRGDDGRPRVTSLFETNVLPLVNAPSLPAFRF